MKRKEKYKFIIKNKILFLLIITSLYFIKYKNIFQQYRVLVFSCCDEFYSHYIPIFCNSLLRADTLKKIDIEIGINLKSLSDNEEKALDYLRKKYPYSKIKIDYNLFEKNTTGVYYKNYKVQPNSVRFISQPKIKDKYVYITDIDILIFIENFYLQLIDDMKRRKNCYSNILRKNKIQLTGLHFIEYDCYYPIKYINNTDILDEKLLYNIMKSKNIKIDEVTQYRPVFGIHMSPNRPYISSNEPIIGWLADNYKFQWIEYIKSNDFKFIYPLLDKSIIDKIRKLNQFYSIDEMLI